MSEKKLCIVILNWNSSEDSLHVIGLLARSPWQICLVDNGSEDPAEVGTIRERYPNVHTIRTGLNLGYAGGMNTGMKWARSQGFSHCLLLNPDTTPSAQVVEEMLNLADGYAIVGTAQVTEDYVPYISAATLNGRKVVPFNCPTSCGLGHEVDIVSGAGILVELATAASAGYMDERFFHYKEEFDFCYRISRLGWKIRFNCGTPLVHRRGGSLAGSSPSAMYYSFRNEMLFLRKHFGPFAWLSSLGLFRNAIVSSFKSPSNIYAILRGLVHGARGTTGPLSDLKVGGMTT